MHTLQAAPAVQLKVPSLYRQHPNVWHPHFELAYDNAVEVLSSEHWMSAK